VHKRTRFILWGGFTISGQQRPGNGGTVPCKSQLKSSLHISSHYHQIVESVTESDSLMAELEDSTPLQRDTRSRASSVYTPHSQSIFLIFLMITFHLLLGFEAAGFQGLLVPPPPIKAAYPNNTRCPV
jgi:hypothetical protein